jgi:hypothetical protein
VLEDIVTASLSDADEALKFLALESDHSDSPHPALNDVWGTSSESNVGSEWSHGVCSLHKDCIHVW